MGDVLEKNMLDVQILGIERIDRLGRRIDNRIRLVIFKLLDSGYKAVILKNWVILKGTNFSFSEDFSRPVKKIRNKLWNSTKGSRNKQYNVL